MDEMIKSEPAIISRPRSVLWAITLLLPFSALIGWYFSLYELVLFAPVWIFPIPWDNMFLIVGWLMSIAPIIVAAILIHPNIRGIGRPSITYPAIALGAIIPIAFAVVFNFYYMEGYSLIMPLPIASLIQYTIYSKIQSS